MRFLLAALLWPIVSRLHKELRIPWALACLTGVMSLVLLNLLITFGLVLAIFKFVQDLPGSATRAGKKRSMEIFAPRWR